jgi:glycosyltransferase involved in cell wall biosynthesis
MPRISVIIPVFNRQHSAERALRSVLDQDLRDSEIVIVDDGSEPPFELPSALVKPNVRIVAQSNRGAAAARNAAIEAARGDWIAFLDSDDYWLPGTLKPRLDLAEREFAVNPEAMVAYVAAFVLRDERSGRQETRIPRPSAAPLHFVSGCWFSPGSTLLVRKAVFRKVGLFDTSLRRLEDLDWFLRFVRAGGRVECWRNVAAMIELGAKPSFAALDAAARRLLSKYAMPESRDRLPAPYIRRLNAYLDLERASIVAARSQWFLTLWYLVRSWVRVPRTTLHLERFWDPA